MSADPTPRHEQPTTPDSFSPNPDALQQFALAEDDGVALLPALTKMLAPPHFPDELGRLGGYRVLGVIGAGGMGIVLRAEDALLRRPVALKLMRPSLRLQPTSRERFLREAQAIAAVDHEHLVRIYAVGEERGLSFFAMELLHGESLSDRLQRGPLPMSEVIRIGKQAALGLHALHTRGLVHRDIKPANVFLANHAAAMEGGINDAGGATKVKILDFGLVWTDAAAPELTEAGASIGTPVYMAPEQAEGKTAGPAADIFSLGCVLYRLCTRRLPFQGLAKTPRRLNPHVPPALNELIVRMLALDPAERPASAAAVADALGEMETESPFAAPAKGRRRSLAIVAAALLLAVLSAASIWWCTRPPSDRLDDIAKPATPRSLAMKVPADQSWTGTGIQLTMGMEVVIHAGGVVDAAPAEHMRPYFLQVPPEGREERVQQVPQPTMPGLCLLGKVGTEVFYVGKECRFTVDDTRLGELHLGINDDIVDDNSGSWTVHIQVIEPKKSAKDSNKN